MSSIGEGNYKDQTDGDMKLPNVLDTKYSNFIMSHSNCPLCGSELELNHKIDSFGLMIKEEARCPHCQIRTRARSHTLQ